MPFWVATTSGSGVVYDPLKVSDEALAELVQGSDLTANPALALERTLRDESSLTRDVVLLTHPFSLTEADLAAAARRLRPGNRLFALAVNGHGQVELSELRQGVPLRVSRFHVELEPKVPAPVKAPVEPWKPWSGDVEPVGFPFRIGVEGDPKPTLLFAFDHAGDWLLTASSHGMLHATRTDGSANEVLPRGMVDDKVLREINGVLGVAGGFVVAGAVEDNLVAFHYDWNKRLCTVHRMPATRETHEFLAHIRQNPGLDRGCWFYERELHSVVWVLGNLYFVAIDLDLGTVVRQPDSPGRAGRALQKIRRYHECPPFLEVDDFHPAIPHRVWIELEERTGEVTLSFPGQGKNRFTPLVDGQPTLRGHKLLMAQCYQATLALALTKAGTPDKTVRLCLYRIPEGVSLGEYKQQANQWAHTLSSDGRLLARQISPVQVEIRPRGESTWGRVMTPRGGFHSGAMMQLGDRWLRLQVTSSSHCVRWDRGVLECTLEKRGLHGGEGGLAELRRLPAWVAYDPHRFLRAAWYNLAAVMDRFGQVFLFDRQGELVCSLIAFQDSLAIWMPDGTCYGSETLLPGWRPPDARKRIGERLLEAWQAGEGNNQ